MTKWEYKTIWIDGSGNGVKYNEIGKEGWELVSVSNKVAYFKRKLS